jgi:hypothetical protein
MTKSIVTSIEDMYPILTDGVEYRACLYNDKDGCYVGYRHFDNVPALKKVKVDNSTNKAIKEAILELQKQLV